MEPQILEQIGLLEQVVQLRHAELPEHPPQLAVHLGEPVQLEGNPFQAERLSKSPSETDLDSVFGRISLKNFCKITIKADQ